MLLEKFKLLINLIIEFKDLKHLIILKVILLNNNLIYHWKIISKIIIDFKIRLQEIKKLLN